VNKLTRIARRGGWGISDQALSSLTNFMVGIFVARTVGPRGFGAFGLAFATYVVALNVARALGPEPLVVRFSASPRAEWRRGTTAATGTALSVGCILGLACLVVALTTGGSVRGAFAAMAVSMPGLLLQDAWRLAFFAGGRGGRAFVNDLVWAVALIPAIGLLLALGIHSVFWLTLAWGAAATVAGVVGLLQARLIPRPDLSLSWLREQRDLAPRFLGEFMALSGTIQLNFFGIGAIAGLEAVGAIRAAQILLGPPYVFSIGVRLAALPEAVRALKHSARRVGRVCVLISAGLATVTLAWGAVMLFLPTRAGVALLGETWEPAHRVLVPVTLAYAAGGVILGASTALRALAAARHSLRARLLVSVLQLSGGVGGAVLGGVTASAWGLAAGGAAGGFVFWWRWTKAIKEYQSAGGPDRRPDDVRTLVPEAPVVGPR